MYRTVVRKLRVRAPRGRARGVRGKKNRERRRAVGSVRWRDGGGVRARTVWPPAQRKTPKDWAKRKRGTRLAGRVAFTEIWADNTMPERTEQHIRRRVRHYHYLVLYCRHTTTRHHYHRRRRRYYRYHDDGGTLSPGTGLLLLLCVRQDHLLLFIYFVFIFFASAAAAAAAAARCLRDFSFTALLRAEGLVRTTRARDASA